MELTPRAIESYCHDRTSPEPELLRELIAETHRAMRHPGMLTGRLEGRLLKQLITISGARRVLEIGMFTGYSALSMAEGLPDDGTLITCDVDPAAKAIAERFFARSPHGRKIEIRLAPALETIATLPGPFDFVFIDADKANYANYYRAVIGKVRTGGLIAIDNTLWHGEVLAPKEADAIIIDSLNREIETDARVENVLIPVRDGLHLVRKL